MRTLETGWPGTEYVRVSPRGPVLPLTFSIIHPALSETGGTHCGRRGNASRTPADSLPVFQAADVNGRLPLNFRSQSLCLHPQLCGSLGRMFQLVLNMSAAPRGGAPAFMAASLGVTTTGENVCCFAYQYRYPVRSMLLLTELIFAVKDQRYVLFCNVRTVLSCVKRSFCMLIQYMMDALM
jgi:hypothetical protein